MAGGRDKCRVNKNKHCLGSSTSKVRLVASFLLVHLNSCERRVVTYEYIGYGVRYAYR